MQSHPPHNVSFPLGQVFRIVATQSPVMFRYSRCYYTMRIFWILLLAIALGTAAGAETALLPLPDRGLLQADSVPQARFQFKGAAGMRISANVEEWLLRAVLLRTSFQSQ